MKVLWSQKVALGPHRYVVQLEEEFAGSHVRAVLAPAVCGDGSTQYMAVEDLVNELEFLAQKIRKEVLE